MARYTPQKSWNTQPGTGIKGSPGPYLAEVMDNVDPLRSGRIMVYIPDLGGDPKDPTNWHLCRYMSPYYGITPLGTSAKKNLVEIQQEITGGFGPGGGGGNIGEQVQQQAQQQEQQPPIESYGFWMQPPDVGVLVLVMFINGDRSRGVWIGCLPEMGSHAAIPGQDKGDFDITTEENQKADDITTIERPEHSTAPTFKTQGIDGDKLRGPITSSSFRESPSKVFGFNSQRGHSFVMDDGSEQGGENKLIRIRTTAGNQIMMNDDAGLIYIINASGTGWVEVSPSGHIDVYGAAGINMATDADINLHADKNVNIHAGENVQIVAMKKTKVQGTEELDLFGKVTKMEGVDALHIHTCKHMRITSFGDMHIKGVKSIIMQGGCLKWNASPAKDAEQVTPEQPKDVTGRQSTVARAPTKEPWKGHDGGGGGGGSATPGSGAMPNGFPAEIAQALQQAGFSNPAQAIASLIGGDPNVSQIFSNLGFNPTDLLNGASGLQNLTKGLGLTADQIKNSVGDLTNRIKEIQEGNSNG